MPIPPALARSTHEPHRVAFYLGDLAAAFHALWNQGNDAPEKRFLLVPNPKLTRARLELADAIGQIIRNGLALMGVEAVRRASTSASDALASVSLGWSFALSSVHSPASPVNSWFTSTAPSLL